MLSLQEDSELEKDPVNVILKDILLGIELVLTGVEEWKGTGP